MRLTPHSKRSIKQRRYSGVESRVPTISMLWVTMHDTSVQVGRIDDLLTRNRINKFWDCNAKDHTLAYVICDCVVVWSEKTKFEILEMNRDQKLPNGRYSKTHVELLKSISVYRPHRGPKFKKIQFFLVFLLHFSICNSTLVCIQHWMYVRYAYVIITYAFRVALCQRLTLCQILAILL